MNWYYLSEEREIGPLSVTALGEIHACGGIGDETPVRRENSVEWAAYSTAFSSKSETRQNPAPPANKPAYKFACTHCQQRISADEDYSGKTVQCPTCGGKFVVPTLNVISNAEITLTESLSAIESTKEAHEKNDRSSLRVKTNSGGKAATKSELARRLGIRKIAVAAIGLVVIFGSVVLWIKMNPRNNHPQNTSPESENQPFAPVSPIPELDAILKPLREAAENGDYEAKFQIGKIYLKGYRGYSMPTRSENYEERVVEFGEAAEFWFEKAVSSCTPDKQADLFFKIGMEYPRYVELEGHGDTHRVNPNAIKWIRKSAELNHADAQHRLAELYFKENDEESAKWTIRAAEQGVVEAQSHAGLSFMRGHYGFSVDLKKSEYWARKAASRGDAQAQSTMARLTGIQLDKFLIEGNDLNQNQIIEKERIQNEHLQWLQRAAKQGEADAQFFLGEWYSRGSGKSDLDAYKWFLIADSHTDSEKLSLAEWHKVRLRKHIQRLADTLSSKEVSEAKTQAAAFRAIKEPKKEGTPEAGAPHADTSNDAALHETMDDITRGLLKSAERGVAIAQYLLAGRYRYGEGVDKNYELAAKWYEKAANQGNVEAQFSLGSLYYLGEGVTKDYTQAEKWLRKAAENGNDVSQYHLGNLYWEGKGVTKNQDEAIKWYMEAAKQGNDRAKTKLNNLHMPQSDPEKRSSAR